jgi:hypothetical protein
LSSSVTATIHAFGVDRTASRSSVEEQRVLDHRDSPHAHARVSAGLRTLPDAMVDAA